MIYALCSLLVVALIAVIISALNPLRKSEEEIKDKILALTPIGTSMEDVLKVIENNKKWKVRQDLVGSKPWPSVPDHVVSSQIDYFIRARKITSCIGRYFNIFMVYAFVDWQFDDNLNLIDIVVKKEANVF